MSLRSIIPFLLVLLPGVASSFETAGGQAAASTTGNAVGALRGCDSSGRADSAACIQAAIDSLPVSRGDVSGGAVSLPPGKYRIDKPLVLTGHSGVRLVGAGMYATVIAPSGDFPAVIDQGRHSAVDNKVGVEHLWIQCAGLEKANAHGIAFTYVNSGVIKDVFFTGCNHALDMRDEWQTIIEGVRVDGRGRQQNAIGVYAGEPTDATDTMPNNALVVSNTTVQNVAEYGFRLAYFAGSKFTNDEAENGKTGWYLCDAAYAIKTLPCQFGHFANILADTTDGSGVMVREGNNTNGVRDVQIANIWVGNTHQNAVFLDGVEYVTVDGLHIASAENGLYIKNSHNVDVQANIRGYNRQNSDAYAVVLDGTTAASVQADTQTPNAVRGYNGIVEINASVNNRIWGGVAPCAIGLAFGGQSAGVSYALQSCQYQIEGLRVSLQFSTGLSSLGGAKGAARLTGLPVPVAGGQPFAGAGIAPVAGESGMAAVHGTMLAQPVPQASYANLFMQGDSGSIPLSSSNFTSASVVSGQLSYFKR